MNLKRRPYDPRKVDADGLPHLGSGENFFHASFDVVGEDKCVEGVVAALDGQKAASLLLGAEAYRRFRSYCDMIHLAYDALTSELTRAEVIELAPEGRAPGFHVEAQRRGGRDSCWRAR